jgi:hypothetical protein
MLNTDHANALKRLQPPTAMLGRKRTGHGIYRLSRRPSTVDRISRFNSLQTAFLEGEIEFKSTHATLAASLVLFDAVVTEEPLHLAMASLPTLWRRGTDVYLEWKLPLDRIDRRALSPISARLAADLRTKTDPADEWESDLIAALSEHYGASHPVREFFHDAVEWYTAVLPGILFGHITLLTPMMPVDRACLARETTGLALALDEPDQELIDAAKSIVTDGYFSPRMGDESDRIIEDIVDSCRPSGPGTAGRKKSLMLQQVFKFLPAARNAGQITSLLAGLVINLIESGTPGKADIAPQSIYMYIKPTLLPLFRILRSTIIEELDGAKWTQIKAAVLEAIPLHQWGHASACLAAFGHYLMDWLDIGLIHEGNEFAADALAPKALVIWTHECDRIREWIPHLNVDERMKSYWMATLAIADGADYCHGKVEGGRIRIGELLKLRLRNIQIDETFVIVEIAFLRRDGKHKSPAGRRRITITTPDAIAQIRRLVERRRAEGAFSTDLLFGDPIDPDQNYRIGEFLTGLNRLLKSATGDKRASFHSLSHTWASRQMTIALSTTDDGEFSPADEIAVRMGNRSVATTVTHYTHLFQLALRERLRIAHFRIKISSRAAAAWSGVSDAALRKRRQRAQEELLVTYWTSIYAALLDNNFHDVGTGLALCTPEPPRFSGENVSPTFVDAIDALTFLSEGKSVEVAALRSSRNRDWIGTLTQCAVTELLSLDGIREAHTSRTAQRRAATVDEAVLTLATLAITKYGISFEKSSSPKFSSVQLTLGKLQPADMKPVVAAWRGMFEHGYLSLDDARDSSVVLEFLKQCGVSHNLLAIAIAKPAGDWTKTRGIPLAPQASIRSLSPLFHDVLVGDRRCHNSLLEQTIKQQAS